MSMEWNEKYSVKVKELDDQHYQLFKQIEALEQGTKNPDYTTTVQTVLNELMEYVMLHFHTEEGYMESVRYENLDEHKRIHEELAQSVNDRVNEMISREVTALDIIKLHNFLSNWIKTHILEEDHLYMEALKPMHDL